LIMISIEYKTAIEKMKKDLNKIERRVVDQAAVTAINKAAISVQGRAIKAIALRTGIKQKLARNYITVTKANYKRPWATVNAAQKRQQNLIEFVQTSRQNPQAFRKATGVKARAWGKATTYKNTFIVYGRNGKAVVVSRKPSATRSGGRWNTGWSKNIYGPSIPETFATKDLMNIMNAVAEYRFGVNFNHEVSRRLAKIRAK